MYIYAHIHRRRQQWGYQTCDLLPISCALYACCIRYVYVSHISSMWVTGLVHMYDTTHLYVGPDSMVCMPWLIRVCDMIIHTCNRTHLYVWQDAYMCMTWPIHMCVTWLNYMCNMTHSYGCSTCSDTATHVLTLQHMFLCDWTVIHSIGGNKDPYSTWCPYCNWYLP